MGSKADFYIGRGIDAEWLGSIQWDGLPEGIPRSILEASDLESYRNEVSKFLNTRSDGILAEQGWPWPWETSHKTKYSYAFDATKNCVMACCFGSNWWPATKPEPDHTTLKRKAAVFPDMTFSKKGGGIYIAPEGVEIKNNGRIKKPRTKPL